MIWGGQSGTRKVQAGIFKQEAGDTSIQGTFCCITEEGREKQALDRLLDKEKCLSNSWSDVLYKSPPLLEELL